jgi:hypothetical protein
VTKAWNRRLRLSVALAAVAALNGCVTVKAPDKPIDINLNVALKQEVLVRLQQDGPQMINKNPQAVPPAPTHP